MNSDLNETSNSCGLKTFLVRRLDESLLLPVVFNNSIVLNSTEVNNLGVIFDQNLAWLGIYKLRN